MINSKYSFGRFKSDVYSACHSWNNPKYNIAENIVYTCVRAVRNSPKNAMHNGDTWYEIIFLS